MSDINKEIIDDSVENEIKDNPTEEKTVEKAEVITDNPVEKVDKVDNSDSLPQEENKDTKSTNVEKSKKPLAVIITLIIVILIIISGFFITNYFKEKKNKQNALPNKKEEVEIKKPEEPIKEEKYKPEELNDVSVINISSIINEGVITDDNYFNNSLFVGDELMTNFGNYIKSKTNGFLGSPKFLTSENLSINTLISPISSDSNHPIYNNKKYLVEDAITELKISTVFIMLGYEDIEKTGINKAISNYKSLIKKIKSKNSGIKIYLINVPYMYKGTETKTINNSFLREFNTKLNTNAQTWGVPVINYAHALIDNHGYLKDEYCINNERVISNNGYNVLINILRSEANTQYTNILLNNAKFLVTTAEASPTYDNYKKALDAVEKLPNGDIKTNYINRLKVVNETLEKNFSNKLSDLTVNGVSINLVKDKYNYDITYASSIQQAIISVKKVSSKAVVTGAETYNLNYGSNTIKIEVKNNNESVTYTLNIKREYDTTIESVKINEENIDINNLVYQVENSIDSVTLSVVGNDPDATITGVGTLLLNVGENNFEFTVNGAKYNIIITREGVLP